MNKKSIILISSLSTLFVVGMTVVVSKGIDSNNSLLGRASNDVTETLTFNRSTTAYQKINAREHTFGKASSSGNNFYLYTYSWYDLSQASYNQDIASFYNLSETDFITFSKSATSLEACSFQTIKSLSIKTSGGIGKMLIYTQTTDGITFTDANPQEVEINSLGVAFSLDNEDANYVRVQLKEAAELHIREIKIKYTCAQ